MLERGISLTGLAGRVGITLANLSILKSNKAKAIRFSTLDALCEQLHCAPGDILKYEMRAEDAE
ncbi:MAG: helix-turn-helix domain-containing protein [Terriglobales bacterium]